MKTTATLLTALLLFTSTTQAAMPDDVRMLQQRWDQVYFQLEGRAQEDAIGTLTRDSEAVLAAHPDSAEACIWRAIILSSDAKINGGLAARGKVAEARTLLLSADRLDPQALDGAIPASLGSLYANVPGWPISYGDKQKALVYLKQALAMAPDNIDALYFMGDLLRQQGDDAQARELLTKALAAPLRSDREVADIGRRNEIRQAIASLSR
ncbi:tetratricopeptide repeat protein [Flagellatimonas centrodinii]|uniref:tetratricopeptide repeat protein n=1 Tax=Flagellatimonas centrodinii TaxID=2806210 RepID=UPI001FEF96FC|nr:tetratricopeptide repeat protein [Flagellatimonas centrodinii]ULQ47250.1 tetratricopeptide repeat protein [Flagellatimonas centrodinii]